jgi:hypothetical protein
MEERGGGVRVKEKRGEKGRQAQTLAGEGNIQKEVTENGWNEWSGPGARNCVVLSPNPVKDAVTARTIILTTAFFATTRSRT